MTKTNITKKESKTGGGVTKKPRSVKTKKNIVGSKDAKQKTGAAKTNNNNDGRGRRARGSTKQKEPTASPMKITPGRASKTVTKKNLEEPKNDVDDDFSMEQPKQMQMQKQKQQLGESSSTEK